MWSGLNCHQSAINGDRRLCRQQLTHIWHKIEGGYAEDSFLWHDIM